MSVWNKVLIFVASRSDEQLDRLGQRIGRTLGYKPVMIQVYRGFGNTHTWYLKGRVIVDKHIRLAEDGDSTWRNLRSTIKRFFSTEIPGVRIKASFGGTSQEVVTDEEGYFDVKITPGEDVSYNHTWHQIELELLDQVSKVQEQPVRATGEVLVPPTGSKYGIISDIDDTVLVTKATSMIQAARLTFLNNARTRLPFEGVAAFYRALQTGLNNSVFNPLFYVSSSSWNLYDLLVDFFKVQNIPTGPFLLRDLSINRTQFIKSSHTSHKFTQIQHILSTYLDLPFILIGDSGQHDPEIYMQAIRDFPGRILAVYIRDVSATNRDEEIGAIIAQAAASGVEMLLVQDTVAAARHAIARGFVEAAALPDIKAEKVADQNAPTVMEQLTGMQKEEPKKE